MLLQQGQSHQVARYFFQIMVFDLTNYSRSVDESVAFCVSLLRGLRQTQPRVLQLWYEHFNELLGEVSDQEDFNLALRMARILENNGLDEEWRTRLLERLCEKLSAAMDVLPDDTWRIKVLTQLTQRCIAIVFARLHPETAESIRFKSQSVQGGEKILNALGSQAS